MLFLIPPSEGKQSGGVTEKRAGLPYELPFEIAANATEKDLKCTGNRYQEGIMLNQQLKENNALLPAIKRYTGVMFNAIDYDNMDTSEQDYFTEHVRILSGFWGWLAPNDPIPNYKLPISAKGLKEFWKDKLTPTLIEQCKQKDITTVVNLLPQVHTKFIDWTELNKHNITTWQVTFYKEKDGENKRMAHGVKGVKGRWLKHVCKETISSIEALKQLSTDDHRVSEVSIEQLTG